jgi:hypothetical protein
MKAPCGNRKRGHRHTLTYLVAGPPTRRGPRRDILGDRCNSGLLWSLVARAVVLDKEPMLDGKPFTGWTKDEACAYLFTGPKNWRRGITPPEEA